LEGAFPGGRSSYLLLRLVRDRSVPEPIETHTRRNKHTQKQTHTHACMHKQNQGHTCMHTYIHTHTHTHTLTQTHIHIHTTYTNSHTHTHTRTPYTRSLSSCHITGKTISSTATPQGLSICMLNLSPFCNVNVHHIITQMIHNL